ncbi:LysR family transcriptional regulator [Abyssibius alkaniclasticus]|uniref:LysR family transcriptional regulator n=1 Tax=Abyssibius alkaniclasticus TaxID=2881234 RepID=UPI0023640213|nr:LysR family transcriptional regulator [Abyssibius alkaniclasticus]UPH71008.1 LysR family transcriptional regulator [Abyssibius alkaniclasticus]
MLRNLDLTALRSFVTVADSGGVTRAAGLLHLTQSAVSMQIKRLEESLGISLLMRDGRGVRLTGEGEKLLGHARRMLAINDEILAQLTGAAFEGEVMFGVPHDIVYPYIPGILQRFALAWPRIKINLESSYTARLKDSLARGELDIILTTEEGRDEGGEPLSTVPLVWVGAPGGQAWKERPLRLAFEHQCRFRSIAQDALDAANIPWDMAVNSENTRTIEASISADLAVHACLAGSYSPYVELVPHGGALPQLPETNINMYVGKGAARAQAERLAEMVRAAYCGALAQAAE